MAASGRHSPAGGLSRKKRKTRLTMISAGNNRGDILATRVLLREVNDVLAVSAMKGTPPD